MLTAYTAGMTAKAMDPAFIKRHIELVDELRDEIAKAVASLRFAADRLQDMKYKPEFAMKCGENAGALMSLADDLRDLAKPWR